VLERKLTAILCADVYGYSRLMGEDEEATLRTLSAYRKIIDSLIENHRGRFVNSAGDSVLAEFSSVVGAVNCAVGIQNALKAENAGLPLARRMEFRIGVNSGDVMVEGEQIYGDGVNVAARLESLADPGGICISGTVYEQVRDKLALSYEDRGEQSVKNIARPVHVWRVVPDGTPTSARLAGKYWRRGVLSLTGLAIAAGTFVLVQHLSLKPPHTSASVPPMEKLALSLPSIPSIAVLPFTNLSGDPQQEYFNDGITDDLITDLSRIPKLFVIARTSSFTYKGKAEKAQSIGRELGVKYLLEGSARKAGGQVRINAQLVDAASGNEVWSQRYDRQMGDIFKLQDELVQSLTTTIGLQLPILASGIAVRQRTNNLKAYDYFLRGIEEFQIMTADQLARAREMFEKAIALDPGYSDAYVMLAFTLGDGYIWQFTSGLSQLKSRI
jgi:adenylate cyclase